MCFLKRLEYRLSVTEEISKYAVKFKISKLSILDIFKLLTNRLQYCINTTWKAINLSLIRPCSLKWTWHGSEIWKTTHSMVLLQGMRKLWLFFCYLTTSTSFKIPPVGIKIHTEVFYCLQSQLNPRKTCHSQLDFNNSSQICLGNIIQNITIWHKAKQEDVHIGNKRVVQ